MSALWTLVDTSVWIRHFRCGEPALEALLLADRVLVHPMVPGEIACGTPPAQSQTRAMSCHVVPCRLRLDAIARPPGAAA